MKASQAPGIDMGDKLPNIIGGSAGIKDVLHNVGLVATRTTVLIEGETGTARKMNASAIHGLSSRSAGPLLNLNCAATPTGLLESELFGHERGAFTGAISQRVGHFELADRGTLFLDEIGDIPLELQPKLLRVLQEQESERLRSNFTLRSNVRIAAATNQSLASTVDEQRFRADLFYRLRIFPIAVPPLRYRRDYVPLLVRHFVEQYARRLNKRIEVIPHSAMDAMKRHSWPGNIRQLQNFIDGAVILTCGWTMGAPPAEFQRANDKITPEPTSRTPSASICFAFSRRLMGRLEPPQDFWEYHGQACTTKLRNCPAYTREWVNREIARTRRLLSDVKAGAKEDIEDVRSER